MPRVGISSLLVVFACFARHDCWLKPPTLKQDVHQYVATVHSTISPQNLDDISSKLKTLQYYLDVFTLQDLIQNPKEAYRNASLDIPDQLRGLSKTFQAQVHEIEVDVAYLVGQIQNLQNSDNTLGTFPPLQSTPLEKNVVICNKSIESLDRLHDIPSVLMAQKTFLDQNTIGEAQQNIVITSYFVAFTFLNQIEVLIFKLKDLVNNLKLFRESCSQTLTSQFSALTLVTKLCYDLPSKASRVLLPEALQCVSSNDHLQINLVLHAGIYGNLFSEEMIEIILLTFSGFTATNLFILYVCFCYKKCCNKEKSLERVLHYPPPSQTESQRFIPLEYEAEMTNIEG